MRSLILILTLAGVVPSAPTQTETAPPPAGKPLEARPTMQKYAEQVAILLQNLRAFDHEVSQEQKQSVRQALTTLKGLSHDVRPTLDLYAVDPIMRYLSLDLSNQFQKIESAYNGQQYPYARYLLRQTTQYCVACHASSSLKHSATAMFKEPDGKLSDLERAEFFGATRRHEESMLAYERFLSHKHFKKAQPELWEKAIQNLLAITIRIRQDASITLEMISARLDEGGYSPQQTELLQAWRASAKAWQLEPRPKNSSATEVLDKARKLMSQGQKLNEQGRNRGFVEFMRTAALLNEIAMGDSSDDIKAQAYLLTGQASENLRDVFLWMHPEAYYEACIRIKPRTSQARECLKQWEFYQQKFPAEAWEKDKLRQLSELAP
jgi:hypothetical protein